MGISYEPKPDSGWQEGESAFADTRRWRAAIGTGVYLSVTVCENAFVISRFTGEERPCHTVPMPQDLQRIELEFGVRAWSIQGCHPVLPPSTGQSLLASAVNPN